MINRALFTLLIALLLGTLLSAPLTSATEPGHSDGLSLSAPVSDWDAVLPGPSSGDETDDAAYLTAAKAVSSAFPFVVYPLPAPADLAHTTEPPHARAPPLHL